MATNPSIDSLQDTVRQIGKAVSGGDPPSTILALLEPLKKLEPTEDLLRKSQLGVAVGRLRSNADKSIASLSSQLVNKWRSSVKTASKKKGTGSANGSPAPGVGVKGVNGSGSGRPSPASSPAPQVKAEKPAKKEGRKSSVEPEKRNSKTDGVSTEVTGNQTRDGCLALMYNGLAFMSEESPDDILAVARDLEKAAYTAYGPETSNTYKQKMRSLFMNLKMKENKLLRRDVFNGNIAPKRFVTMTSDELKSAEKRASDAELEKQNMSSAMVAQEVKAISNTFQCGKCKNKKVSYSQAQTRSADEPMTTFCECTVCGNRWKFS